jgi:hypothetical protein
VTAPEPQGFPGDDEIATAWANAVVPNLRGLAKPIYQGARLLDSDNGTVVVAVPNAAHRDRCESSRADVEAALATQFGRRIPVRIVIDATESVPSPSDQPALPDDIPDPSELVDAPDAGANAGVDRLTQAFPGATWEEE